MVQDVTMSYFRIKKAVIAYTAIIVIVLAVAYWMAKA
jgi:hypothetical protein